MSRSIAAAEMFGAEDCIFTERRIRLYAVSMAVAIVAVSAWEFLHGRSVIDPRRKAGLHRLLYHMGKRKLCVVE